jgi:hypothetical protein
MTQFRFLLIAMLGTVAADDSYEAGQLTAADVDDNLNFEWYLRFKEGKIIQDQQQYNGEGGVLTNPFLADRIPIEITDSSGEPFSCAQVEVNGKILPATTSGRLSLFPTMDGLTTGELLQITVKPHDGTCPDDCVSTTIVDERVASTRTTELEDGTEDGTSSAKNTIRDTVRMQISSQAASPPTQLDLALLVDTTGSMCDEIDYLIVELGKVLEEAASGIDVRLAYIAFKSADDMPYAVRVSPFGSTPNFSDELATEECSGGGNGELVNKALEEATKLEWRSGNVARLVLIVGDEPPHGSLKNDMQEAFEAAVGLRGLGVRVYGLAASGVDDAAEYLFRLISLITGARYLWLTDDSGIGDAHGEPEVLCYQVSHLDKLLYRVIRSELTGKRVEVDPAHILREVGQQTAGVCIYELNGEEDDNAMGADIVAGQSYKTGSAAPAYFSAAFISLMLLLAVLGSFPVLIAN